MKYFNIVLNFQNLSQFKTRRRNSTPELFGLLHGFGFASALSEVGLPQQAIPLALLFFNVGVEIGQLVFIAIVLAVIYVLRYLMLPWPKWAWRVPAQLIGVTAAFWTIQRVVGFWG